MTTTVALDELLAIEDVEERTDAFLDRVRTLLPLIREKALESEERRSTVPEIIDAAREIGFFTGLVPRRWGGLGLGFRALAESARILATGDVSAAWQLCFLMEHNLMACHMPWQTQEEIFRDQNYFLAAGPMVPYGKAVKVDGGYRVTGTHRYASGFPNSDWSFYGSMLHVDGSDPVHYVFLSPKSDLIDNDDWHFAGASASGSGSFSTDDTFVPDGYAMPYADFFSGRNHEGVAHDEPLMRYLLVPVLTVMVAGFAAGSAQRVEELATEKILNTKIFGVNRKDQPTSRVRWAAAHQRNRAIQLQFQQLIDTVEGIGEGQWSSETIAQLSLDAIFLDHEAKETIRQFVDGAGSGVYHKSDPAQRYMRDINVITNHVAADWDWQADICAAAILGVKPYAGYGQAAKADGSRDTTL